MFRTCHRITSSFFFFNDTATTEIYTLSLHDALPIWSSAPAASRRRSASRWRRSAPASRRAMRNSSSWATQSISRRRSEEHTSELQSPDHLVCRLLLEKKKKKKNKARQ